MLRTGILCLCISALCRADGAPPPAEPPKPTTIKLSLKECIALALSNNLDIKVSVQQVRSAEGDLTSAWGVADPTLYATETYEEEEMPTGSFLSGLGGAGIALSQAQIFQSAAGIRQRLLWTGMQVDLGTTINKQNTNSQFATINPAWTVQPAAKITQPILRGFGPDANLAQIRLARANQRVARDQFRADLTTAVLNVENAYYDLIAAIKQKDVKEKSLKLAETLLEVNRAKVKAGTMAPIEELQAESQVASQQVGILDAQRAIEDAEDALKRLVRPTWRDRKEWEAEIAPTEELANVERKAETDESIRQALARRPEYAAIEKQVEAQNVNMALQRNNLLPQLDVVGLYEQTGLGSTSNASFLEMGQDQPQTWAVTLNFTYPLGNNSAKGALWKADADRRRLTLQMIQLEQGIIAEVRQTVRAVATTSKQIDAAKKATELATKQLEAEQKRLDLGVSTSFQVLQFQSDLATAESQETAAYVNHIKAIVALQKAIGTLLEENGIALDPDQVDR